MALDKHKIDTVIDQQKSDLIIAVSDAQIGLWSDYLQLLSRWNRVYNLTSITALDEMRSVHLYDSLSVASFITARRIADIGSGGGLPGIVLAVLFPEKSFILVDTNSKKTRFLRQVTIELGLDNVEVVHSRVEDMTVDERFGQIISRAFTSLDRFVSSSEHLLEKEGQWLAMKGRLPRQELADIPQDLAYTVIPLQVPEMDAERHLIQLHRRQLQTDG